MSNKKRERRILFSVYSMVRQGLECARVDHLPYFLFEQLNHITKIVRMIHTASKMADTTARIKIILFSLMTLKLFCHSAVLLRQIKVSVLLISSVMIIVLARVLLVFAVS